MTARKSLLFVEEIEEEEVVEYDSRPMRFALLWCLFFVICLGLGYPTLNRYDPSHRDPDTVQYREMTIHGVQSAPEHFAHRVVIPLMARCIYKLADGHIGSWDTGYFGLLIANSIFTSGAAALLVLVAEIVVGSAPAALLAATLYLLNFAVANLFLIGFVDSGEAFFMLLVTWALLTKRSWVLPPALIVGTLTKETFLILCAVFTITWFISDGSPIRRRMLAFAIGVALALGALLAAFRLTTGDILGFAMSNDSGDPKSVVAVSALKHRALWYVFAYIFPLGLPCIKQVPRAWRWATMATFVVLFVLEVIHVGAVDVGPALARPAFSVAGPILACSMALFMDRLIRKPEDSESCPRR